MGVCVLLFHHTHPLRPPLQIKLAPSLDRRMPYSLDPQVFDFMSQLPGTIQLIDQRVQSKVNKENGAGTVFVLSRPWWHLRTTTPH